MAYNPQAVLPKSIQTQVVPTMGATPSPVGKQEIEQFAEDEKSKLAENKKVYFVYVSLSKNNSTFLQTIQKLNKLSSQPEILFIPSGHANDPDNSTEKMIDKLILKLKGYAENGHLVVFPYNQIKTKGKDPLTSEETVEFDFGIKPDSPLGRILYPKLKAFYQSIKEKTHQSKLETTEKSTVSRAETRTSTISTAATPTPTPTIASTETTVSIIGNDTSGNVGRDSDDDSDEVDVDEMMASLGNKTTPQTPVISQSDDLGKMLDDDDDEEFLKELAKYMQNNDIAKESTQNQNASSSSTVTNDELELHSFICEKLSEVAINGDKKSLRYALFAFHVLSTREDLGFFQNSQIQQHIYPDKEDKQYTDLELLFKGVCERLDKIQNGSYDLECYTSDDDFLELIDVIQKETYSPLGDDAKTKNICDMLDQEYSGVISSLPKDDNSPLVAFIKGENLDKPVAITPTPAMPAIDPSTIVTDDEQNAGKALQRVIYLFMRDPKIEKLNDVLDYFGYLQHKASYEGKYKFYEKTDTKFENPLEQVAAEGARLNYYQKVFNKFAALIKKYETTKSISQEDLEDLRGTTQGVPVAKSYTPEEKIVDNIYHHLFLLSGKVNLDSHPNDPEGLIVKIENEADLDKAIEYFLELQTKFPEKGYNFFEDIQGIKTPLRQNYLLNQLFNWILELSGDKDRLSLDSAKKELLLNAIDKFSRISDDLVEKEKTIFAEIIQKLIAFVKNDGQENYIVDVKNLFLKLQLQGEGAYTFFEKADIKKPKIQTPYQLARLFTCVVELKQAQALKKQKEGDSGVGNQELEELEKMLINRWGNLIAARSEMPLNTFSFDQEINRYKEEDGAIFMAKGIKEELKAKIDEDIQKGFENLQNQVSGLQHRLEKKVEDITKGVETYKQKTMASLQQQVQKAAPSPTVGKSPLATSTTSASSSSAPSASSEDDFLDLLDNALPPRKIEVLGDGNCGFGAAFFVMADAIVAGKFDDKESDNQALRAEKKRVRKKWEEFFNKNNISKKDEWTFEFIKIHFQTKDNYASQAALSQTFAPLLRQEAYLLNKKDMTKYKQRTQWMFVEAYQQFVNAQIYKAAGLEDEDVNKDDIFVRCPQIREYFDSLYKKNIDTTDKMLLDKWNNELAQVFLDYTSKDRIYIGDIELYPLLSEYGFEFKNGEGILSDPEFGLLKRSEFVDDLDDDNFIKTLVDRRVLEVVPVDANLSLSSSQEKNYKLKTTINCVKNAFIDLTFCVDIKNRKLTKDFYNLAEDVRGELESRGIVQKSNTLPVKFSITSDLTEADLRKRLVALPHAEAFEKLYADHYVEKQIAHFEYNGINHWDCLTRNEWLKNSPAKYNEKRVLPSRQKEKISDDKLPSPVSGVTTAVPYVETATSETTTQTRAQTQTYTRGQAVQREYEDETITYMVAPQSFVNTDSSSYQLTLGDSSQEQELASVTETTVTTITPAEEEIRIRRPVVSVLPKPQTIITTENNDSQQFSAGLPQPSVSSTSLASVTSTQNPIQETDRTIRTITTTTIVPAKQIITKRPVAVSTHNKQDLALMKNTSSNLSTKNESVAHLPSIYDRQVKDKKGKTSYLRLFETQQGNTEEKITSVISEQYHTLKLSAFDHQTEVDELERIIRTPVKNMEMINVHDMEKNQFGDTKKRADDLNKVRQQTNLAEEANLRQRMGNNVAKSKTEEAKTITPKEAEKQIALAKKVAAESKAKLLKAQNLLNNALIGLFKKLEQDKKELSQEDYAPILIETYKKWRSKPETLKDFVPGDELINALIFHTGSGQLPITQEMLVVWNAFNNDNLNSSCMIWKKQPNGDIQLTGHYVDDEQSTSSDHILVSFDEKQRPMIKKFRAQEFFAYTDKNGEKRLPLVHAPYHEVTSLNQPGEKLTYPKGHLFSNWQELHALTTLLWHLHNNGHNRYWFMLGVIPIPNFSHFFDKPNVKKPWLQKILDFLFDGRDDEAIEMLNKIIPLYLEEAVELIAQERESPELAQKMLGQDLGKGKTSADYYNKNVQIYSGLSEAYNCMKDLPAQEEFLEKNRKDRNLKLEMAKTILANVDGTKQEFNDPFEVSGRQGQGIHSTGSFIPNFYKIKYLACKIDEETGNHIVYKGNKPVDREVAPDLSHQVARIFIFTVALWGSLTGWAGYKGYQFGHTVMQGGGQDEETIAAGEVAGCVIAMSGLLLLGVMSHLLFTNRAWNKEKYHIRKTQGQSSVVGTVSKPTAQKVEDARTPLIEEMKEIEETVIERIDPQYETVEKIETIHKPRLAVTIFPQDRSSPVATKQGSVSTTERIQNTPIVETVGDQFEEEVILRKAPQKTVTKTVNKTYKPRPIVVQQQVAPPAMIAQKTVRRGVETVLPEEQMQATTTVTTTISTNTSKLAPVTSTTTTAQPARVPESTPTNIPLAESGFEPDTSANKKGDEDPEITPLFHPGFKDPKKKESKFEIPTFDWENDAKNKNAPSKFNPDEFKDILVPLSDIFGDSSASASSSKVVSSARKNYDATLGQINPAGNTPSKREAARSRVTRRADRSLVGTPLALVAVEEESTTSQKVPLGEPTTLSHATVPSSALQGDARLTDVSDNKSANLKEFNDKHKSTDLQLPKRLHADFSHATVPSSALQGADARLTDVSDNKPANLKGLNDKYESTDLQLPKRRPITTVSKAAPKKEKLREQQPKLSLVEQRHISRMHTAGKTLAPGSYIDPQGRLIQNPENATALKNLEEIISLNDKKAQSVYHKQPNNNSGQMSKPQKIRLLNDLNRMIPKINLLEHQKDEKIKKLVSAAKQLEKQMPDMLTVHGVETISDQFLTALLALKNKFKAVIDSPEYKQQFERKSFIKHRNRPAQPEQKKIPQPQQPVKNKATVENTLPEVVVPKVQTSLKALAVKPKGTPTQYEGFNRHSMFVRKPHTPANTDAVKPLPSKATTQKPVIVDKTTKLEELQLFLGTLKFVQQDDSTTKLKGLRKVAADISALVEHLSRHPELLLDEQINKGYQLVIDFNKKVKLSDKEKSSALTENLPALETELKTIEKALSPSILSEVSFLKKKLKGENDNDHTKRLMQEKYDGLKAQLDRNIKGNAKLYVTETYCAQIQELGNYLNKEEISESEFNDLFDKLKNALKGDSSKFRSFILQALNIEGVQVERNFKVQTKDHTKNTKSQKPGNDVNTHSEDTQDNRDEVAIDLEESEDETPLKKWNSGNSSSKATQLGQQGVVTEQGRKERLVELEKRRVEKAAQTSTKGNQGKGQETTPLLQGQQKLQKKQ